MANGEIRAASAIRHSPFFILHCAGNEFVKIDQSENINRL